MELPTEQLTVTNSDVGNLSSDSVSAQPVDGVSYNSLREKHGYTVEQLGVEILIGTPSFNNACHLYMSPTGEELYVVELLLPHILARSAGETGPTEEAKTWSYSDIVAGAVTEDVMITNVEEESVSMYIDKMEKEIDITLPPHVYRECRYIELVLCNEINEIDVQWPYRITKDTKLLTVDIESVPIDVNVFKIGVEPFLPDRENKDVLLPIHSLSRGEQEFILEKVIDNFSSYPLQVKQLVLEALANVSVDIRQCVDYKLYNMIYCNYSRIIRDEYASLLVLGEHSTEIIDELVSVYSDSTEHMTNEAEATTVLTVAGKLKESNFTERNANAYMEKVFWPMFLTELKRYYEWSHTDVELSTWQLPGKTPYRWQIAVEWLQTIPSHNTFQLPHLVSIVELATESDSFRESALLFATLLTYDELGYTTSDNFVNLLKENNEQISEWFQHRSDQFNIPIAEDAHSRFVTLT